MRSVLTLQIPTDDWRRGRILAASTDPATIRWFCDAVIAQRTADLDAIDDPFSRELARLDLEQLSARFAFAMGA